jgi:predicted GTPase
MTFNCVIMGAAGRDFHDFHTFFRRNPEFHVRAFTATQIPDIEFRSFPQSLAGDDFESDIPIYPESRLSGLIHELDIDFVFLAYSDLPHVEVMHKASIVQAAGASFAFLGPKHTQLESSKPVISVTAVRTGAGKSPLSQMIAKYLADQGRSVGVIRHPMPYGQLERQVVERFAEPADLDRFDCTIEEREEYEPYIELGLPIFAGVDYQQILRAAEHEADVILWDGGNNDYSFIRPDLSIVVVDALRAGHETEYYPGETNFRSADVLVINKVGHANPQAVAGIQRRIEQTNPTAQVVTADLEVAVDTPELISGRRALVVEDGPTVTHGGMGYGAGFLAAQRYEAQEIIDPRSSAVGSIAAAFEKYPHIGTVLPALGYSARQCSELESTINNSAPDVVVDASPARLDRVIQTNIPVARVRYRFRQVSGDSLLAFVETALASSRL